MALLEYDFKRNCLKSDFTISLPKKMIFYGLAIYQTLWVSKNVVFLVGIIPIALIDTKTIF